MQVVGLFSPYIGFTLTLNQGGATALFSAQIIGTTANQYRQREIS